ncbi:hypothetical protein [Flavihumibacter petaseus]|uniref:Lipoprotein n=1 Tax=Flavihumibacter petaseus NBRC 106054 TaxID=1220578 RepID=A0A0E9N5P1_9BACT|nr:hypothetical protein [Flavihumibacter petaseus]GAO45282.1 hypothetical protein FPE01S_04_05260 [Flavihumibacter petaseus NBRC 106054]
MKKIKILLALGIAVCFTACIQIDEEVELKSDGSGKMKVHSDMGKMFEMLKGFASEEEMAKEGMGREMDTTILMKDLVDTATNMTAENKALLRNGVLNLKMNMKNNVFLLDMAYPFSNLADANKLYTAMNQGGMMGNVFKGLNPAAGGGEGESDGLGKIGNMYDVKLSNGEYSRTLNKTRYDSVMNDPKVQESKGMMAMMGDMSMNLTVKLPRPAKTVSNPKATLSGDKKTVYLKNDLLIALDSPKNMEIVIRY